MIKIKKFALCSFLTALAQGSMAAQSVLADSERVKHTITTMVNGIDNKQWALAQAQFSSEVYVDYSSLNGLPGSKVKASDLINGWKNLLSKVSTHHMLTNFDISVKGNSALAYSHVYASHTAPDIEYWDAYGRYEHKLTKHHGQWKIDSMSLLMHGQKGNRNFLQEVSEMNPIAKTTMKKVEFNSEGKTLVGHIYYPANFDANKQYPAVIVSGSWTTVKEQMAGLYAEKLAQQGFITLAFDFRNFGESQGQMRFHEQPLEKVKDIKHAVSYLQQLDAINPERVGTLGICAGAMYTLIAASEDARIKSVVTVASWLHDAEAVKLFYGGEEGVQNKIAAAMSAKKKYKSTGEIDYIPAISTSDPSAAMYGPYDYYLNPQRGAIPQWSADKFAVATWQDWLTIDPMPSAAKLNAATLMIHSDGAVLPEYTKQYFADIATDTKRLHWLDTDLASPYHQFNFYDQEAEVTESIVQASQWFNTHL